MNEDAFILNAAGRRIWKFGDVVHQQFTSGSYIVSIEWHGKGRECEPMMAIWSATGGRDAGVLGICLDALSYYADPSGGPARTAFYRCWTALPLLGRNQLEIEVFKLLDVILRHAPDLIRCPPMPPAMRLADAPEPLLDVVLADEDGKTLKEETL